MKIQQDHKLRVVALSNLEAMCKRMSGVCHRFSVSRVTENRAYIEYSNPDEYGHASPMTASFPAWHYSTDHCVVALEILKVTKDNWQGEGWQAFQPLLDCPELYRSSPEATDWQTHKEILGVELSPEKLTAQLVQIAQDHGSDSGEADHAIGDLEAVLKLCLETMTENQRARALSLAKEQAGLEEETK
jgi:hypothetical protein